MQAGCMTPVKGVDWLSDGGLSHVSSAAPMSRLTIDWRQLRRSGPIARSLAATYQDAGVCRPTTLPRRRSIAALGNSTCHSLSTAQGAKVGNGKKWKCGPMGRPIEGQSVGMRGAVG